MLQKHDSDVIKPGYKLATVTERLQHTRASSRQQYTQRERPPAQGAHAASSYRHMLSNSLPPKMFVAMRSVLIIASLSTGQVKSAS